MEGGLSTNVIGGNRGIKKDPAGFFAQVFFLLCFPKFRKLSHKILKFFAMYRFHRLAVLAVKKPYQGFVSRSAARFSDNITVGVVYRCIASGISCSLSTNFMRPVHFLLS